MVQKEYKGAAEALELNGAISGAATSFTSSATPSAGWPTGSSFPFVVVIGRGTSSEEKILCTSRSGATFTVSARGYDDTSATSHSLGETIEHILDAASLTEANAHVNDDTRDDHSQYLNTTRHDAHDHTTALGTASVEDLADVNLTGKASGDLLKYDGANIAVQKQGSGNGLDADTVDALESTALLARANHTGTQAISTLSDHTKANHDSLGLDHGALSGKGDDDHTQYYNAARHTKAVHDALNIDADTLDSLTSSQFLRSDTNDSMTGDLTITGELTVNSNVFTSLSMYAGTGGSAAGVYGASPPDGVRIYGGGTDKIEVKRAGGECMALRRESSTGTIATFRYGDTSVGSISVTGSATAYNTSSDYRLKENVKKLASALDAIRALRPVTFDWKADGEQGYGFIAHEAQEVLPHIVHGQKDATHVPDGSDEEQPLYQSVDYSKVVPHLVAAVQELSAEVASLRAQLEG